MLFNFYTEIFVTLFITINPVGIIAPFLQLTSHNTRVESNIILRKAIIFAFIILSVILFTGKYLLSALGLQTYALQIAGGILFFHFGWQTIQGRNITISQDDPSFVPLGFPIIAGPGSITAIIIFTTLYENNSTNSLTSYVFILIIIIILLMLTYLLLRNALNIQKIIGVQATNALTKIMGLFIITLGIQLILSGIMIWIELSNIGNLQ
jgi:multiple antibiotic resistance protein